MRDMADAKHTPLPWYMDRAHRGETALIWIDSCDAPSEGIADLYHRVPDSRDFVVKGNAEANAALIVRAVNAHSDAILLARAIIDYLGGDKPIPPELTIETALMGSARVFLIKAEGV